VLKRGLGDRNHQPAHLGAIQFSHARSLLRSWGCKLHGANALKLANDCLLLLAPAVEEGKEDDKELSCLHQRDAFQTILPGTRSRPGLMQAWGACPHLQTSMLASQKTSTGGMFGQTRARFRSCPQAGCATHFEHAHALTMLSVQLSTHRTITFWPIARAGSGGALDEPSHEGLGSPCSMSSSTGTGTRAARATQAGQRQRGEGPTERLKTCRLGLRGRQVAPRHPSLHTPHPPSLLKEPCGANQPRFHPYPPDWQAQGPRAMAMKKGCARRNGGNPSDRHRDKAMPTMKWALRTLWRHDAFALPRLC